MGASALLVKHSAPRAWIFLRLLLWFGQLTAMSSSRVVVILVVLASGGQVFQIRGDASQDVHDTRMIKGDIFSVLICVEPEIDNDAFTAFPSVPTNRYSAAKPSLLPPIGRTFGEEQWRPLVLTHHLRPNIYRSETAEPHRHIRCFSTVEHLVHAARAQVDGSGYPTNG